MNPGVFARFETGQLIGRCQEKEVLIASEAAVE